MHDLRSPPAADPRAPRPIAEGPIAEGPIAEGPIAEGPIAEKPVAEGPIAEGPIAEADRRTRSRGRSRTRSRTRPLRRLLAATMLFAVVGLSSTARAEADEVSIGVEAGVVLPGFESPDPTAFALATWGVSGWTQYGLLDWLYATGRLSFSTYSAKARGSEMFQSRLLEGVRVFELTQLHPEIGLRAKLYGGYNLAPYFETGVGLLWAIYRNQDLRNEQGQSFGLELEDEGEGRFTVSAGLGVDYRIANLFFVGAAVRYVEVIGGGRFRRYLAAPVQFSVYF